MWRMKIKFCARFPHNSIREVWSLSATPPPSDVTRVVLIYRYQKITSKRASLPKTRTAFHNLLFLHRLWNLRRCVRVTGCKITWMSTSSGILLPLLKLWRGWMGSHILTGLQGNMKPFSASHTTNIIRNIGRWCTRNIRFHNPDWCTLETCTIYA